MWFVPVLVLGTLAVSGCGRTKLLDEESMTIAPGRFQSAAFRTKAGSKSRVSFHVELDLIHISGPAVHVLLLTKEEFNRFEDGTPALEIKQAIVTKQLTDRPMSPPTSKTWLNMRKSFKATQFIGRTPGSQHYLVVANPGKLGGPAAQVTVSALVRRDLEK